MTCKDCVSYEVCRIVRNNGDDRVFENSPCGYFKNKADFVEVVRCEKCKWYIGGRMQCGHPFVLFSDRLMTTQFCSYGERRDT